MEAMRCIAPTADSSKPVVEASAQKPLLIFADRDKCPAPVNLQDYASGAGASKTGAVYNKLDAPNPSEPLFSI